MIGFIAKSIFTWHHQLMISKGYSHFFNHNFLTKNSRNLHMKSIHLGVSLCLNLLVFYAAKAQTPITWGSSTTTVSISGSLFQSLASPTAITNSNGIEANQDGFIEFTLNQAVGNGVVGLGFTDATNTTPNINNSYVGAAFNGTMFQCFKPDYGWNSFVSEWGQGNDAAGVKIKIERIGTSAKYYHNGILKGTALVSAGIKLVPVIIFTDGTSGKSVNVSAQISGPGVGNPTPVVQFDYDEAGNRIKRKYVTVVLPRSSKPAAPEPTHIEAFALKVFPNPSDGHFEVTIEKTEDGMMLEVYDVAGKQVHKQPVAGLNTSVDVSHLARGIYVLTCRDAQKIKGQWKLMIQ
jgi:Secretion system C-terminal sorting domain